MESHKDVIVKAAAELPTDLISACIPPSLSDALKTLQHNKTIPWLVTRVSWPVPNQHSMHHTHVYLEDTESQQPSLLWNVSLMSPGSAKSQIHSFMCDIMDEIHDENGIIDLTASSAVNKKKKLQHNVGYEQLRGMPF